MKKFGSVALILLAAFLSVAWFGFEGGTSKAMQQDFDKIRLDHLLVISSLIAEYNDKVGHYPFAEQSTQPIFVKIATAEQLKNNRSRLRIYLDLETRAENGRVPEQPRRLEERTLHELVAELEKGLKRPVKIPVDPQRVPVNKPSMYYYTYYLGVFDVTGFLHNDLSFARQLGPFNNKITIGSRSDPSAGIWTPEELKANEDFRRFFRTPFNRPGYTLKTEL